MYFLKGTTWFGLKSEMVELKQKKPQTSNPTPTHQPTNQQQKQHLQRTPWSLGSSADLTSKTSHVALGKRQTENWQAL